MEIVGSFLDEEWESLSQMFSIGENADFSLHCDGSHSSSLFSSNVEIPSPSFEANLCSISQESSNITGEMDEALFLNINHGNEDHHHHQLFDAATNNNHALFESMNFHNTMPVLDEFLSLNDQPLQTADSTQEMQLIKRKSEADFSTQNPKKKPRNAQAQAQKSRKTSKKSKKSTIKIHEKINEEEEEEEEISINGGSGNSCSSEEDSNNASQQLMINGGTTSESNAKTRATRGSATDPQSLYARKRRERINERLKVLQNLVPNGTKVDISTMLEEAVQYVKFLQLQIKLLSSDNLWMYAPLAYNGMDIGIYQNISPNFSL